MINKAKRHYWSKFRRTITGRVLVEKTFVISQATFFMGILPLDKKKAAKTE